MNRHALPRCWQGMMVVLGWLLLAPIASAHQQKTAISTVFFNPRSGQLEIMHRFYIHDAEHALLKRQGTAVDLLNDAAARQLFADHVHQHFQLRRANGQTPGSPLPLQLVGHEVDGKFIWIYQESSVPETLTGLQVRHNSLQDLWPSQRNLVNIEGRGALQSLQFLSGDMWKTVEFASPPPP